MAPVSIERRIDVLLWYRLVGAYVRLLWNGSARVSGFAWYRDDGPHLAVGALPLLCCPDGDPPRQKVILSWSTVCVDSRVCVSGRCGFRLLCLTLCLVVLESDSRAPAVNRRGW